MNSTRLLRHRLITLFAAVALLIGVALPALALVENAANSTPIAENLSFTTYKNVSVSHEFSAVDPDGDPITYRLTDNPARGAVTMPEGNGRTFVYTPYENKTGKDSFSYVAVDDKGNESEPAKVSIRIEKAKTKVTYSDMGDNLSYRSALKLAEQDIFIGEQIGASYFFDPDATITRSSFVAMALTAAGVKEYSVVSRTGFADDDQIPTWAKGYVATALKSGVVQGMNSEYGQVIFNPNAPITRAEAAVVINKVLQIADVSSSIAYDEADVPTWAYQAAVNLQTCGLLSADEAGSLRLEQTLNRSDAADMLCAALELLEERDAGKGWFNW